MQEARAAAALDHPNVVSVHEVGEDGPVCYIASAYCAGPTLAHWLRHQARSVTPRDAAELVAALADGVEHAHRRGVLHRDIKPSNVLLFLSGGWPSQAVESQDAPKKRDGLGSPSSGNGGYPLAEREGYHGDPLSEEEGYGSLTLRAFTPRLTDFGLAKLTEQAGETHTGDRMGTLPYMSPEQAEGRVREIGPATDVYSLGVLLYELLAGRVPYLGVNEADTLRQLLAADLQPPHSWRPDVPRDLEAICLRCLEARPPDRYASANELADDLRRYLAAEPTRARPWSKVRRLRRAAKKHPTLAVAMVALVLLCVGGWWSAASIGRALEVARTEQAKSDRMGYAQAVRLGWHAWQHDQPEQARQWLEAARPKLGREDLREFAYWHLWKLTHQEKLTLTGAQDELLCVAFSPDGHRVAAGGKDRAARIWDAETGRLLHTLRHHTDEVNGIAFQVDGQTLATAGQDGRLCLWNTGTGNMSHEWIDKSNTPLLCLALSPNGELLAAGDDVGRVRLWDTGAFFSPSERAAMRETTTIGELPPLVGHRDRIGTVAFSADGKLMASGSEDRSVILWDVATRGEHSRMENFRSTISSVSFSMDGEWLATACKQDRCVYHSALKGRLTRAGNHWWRYDDPAWIQAVQFCAKNFWAIGCKDGALKLLDTGLMRRCDSHTDRIWALAATRDGSRLASASADRTVKIWQPDDPDTLLILPCSNTLVDVTFSANGKLLVSGGSVNTFTVTDATTGEVTLDVGLEFDLQGDFDGDGRQDKGFFLDGRWQFNLAGKEDAQWRRTFGRRGDIPIVGDWNGDGSDDIAVYNDGVWRFEVDNGPESAELVVATGELATRVPAVTPELIKEVEARWQDPRHGTESSTFVALAPKGGLVATARYGVHSIKLWYLETGNRFAVLTVDGEPLAADFSPDGALLATGDSIGNTVLWDVATRTRRQTLLRQPAGVTAVRFSPDGRLLAAACQETVKLWEAATGTVIATIGTSKPHEEWHDLKFSPDGKRLAGAFSAGKAVVWDVATSQQLLTLPVGQEVWKVSFSSEGQTLATAAASPARVQLWDMRTGQELVALECPFGWARAVAFSPSGNRLAAAGSVDASRGYIYIWGGAPGR